MKESELIDLVNNQIGSSISTIYGPSLVVGIETSDDGSKLVHLREFGEEEYYIRLADFPDLIQ